MYICAGVWVCVCVDEILYRIYGMNKEETTLSFLRLFRSSISKDKQTDLMIQHTLDSSKSPYILFTSTYLKINLFVFSFRFAYSYILLIYKDIAYTRSK